MKTKLKQPTTAQWKKLYEIAAELKELAPWNWMDETRIFGVENPDTKEIGFISTMGMMGEHLALGVYLGAEGLYKFWDFQEIGHELEPLALFEIPQLQVSFEDREHLEKEDRDVHKKLGLKFRGRKNYPMFRSIRPGFLPWFIDLEEANFLIYAIEQTLEVAPSIKENPAIVEGADNRKNKKYLVRAAENKNKKTVWQDEMKSIAPPEQKKISVKIPTETVSQFKEFPQNKKLIFEMNLFYMPTPIAEKGKRPCFPKMLMIAETNSGAILGVEILEPQENDSATYADVAENLAKIWSQHPVLPKEIRVGSDLLFDLLRDFTQQLNIKLIQTDELTAVENAQEAMFGFFLGDDF